MTLGERCFRCVKLRQQVGTQVATKRIKVAAHARNGRPSCKRHLPPSCIVTVARKIKICQTYDIGRRIKRQHEKDCAPMPRRRVHTQGRRGCCQQDHVSKED